MGPRRVVALVVVCVALFAGALLLTRDGGVSDGLEQARRLLRDDDRFTTAFKAGDTLARVGELLQDDGEACRSRRGDDPLCGHLLSASAVAQVMAFRVLSCTAPGRFEARSRMTDHLDALAAGRVPVDPPAPPSC